MHVPMEQHIFKAIEEKLLIPHTCNVWRKLDDYKIYLEYQKKIREEIQKKNKKASLRWEMSGWIDGVEQRG